MKSTSAVIPSFLLVFALMPDTPAQSVTQAVRAIPYDSGTAIPKPQDLVNLSGTVTANGQPGLVFTVPAGKWFVLTDIQAASFMPAATAIGGFSCGALDPSFVAIKEGLTGTVMWSKGMSPFATGGYRLDVGIPFAPGSQVVLEIDQGKSSPFTTTPVDIPVSWHLAGYLSGPSADMPWPPRPENIVSVSGSITGTAGGSAATYSVPVGKWLVVTDLSVVTMVEFSGSWTRERVDFAELAETVGSTNTVRRPGYFARIVTTNPTVDIGSFLPAGSHYAPKTGMAFAPGSVVTLNVGPANPNCVSFSSPNGLRTDWHLVGYLVKP